MASVVVLGTSHQFQGLRNSVADPDYEDLVAQLICLYQIDFIFEEASGLDPTKAQGLAESLVPNRYLDIDPHRDERCRFGIAQETGSPQPIDPDNPNKSSEVAWWVTVGEHAKREELWLRRILELEFEHGLVICGFFHTLSFALRLRSAGLKPAITCPTTSSVFWLSRQEPRIARSNSIWQRGDHAVPMPDDSTKEKFLRDDLYDALRWLFVGAVPVPKPGCARDVYESNPSPRSL